MMSQDLQRVLSKAEKEDRSDGMFEPPPSFTGNNCDVNRR